MAKHILEYKPSEIRLAAQVCAALALATQEEFHQSVAEKGVINSRTIQIHDNMTAVANAADLLGKLALNMEKG